MNDKYEDVLSRFNDRMKEAPKVILVPFNFTLKLTLKARDENDAQDTLEIIRQHLLKFDDITNVVEA